MLGIQMRLLTVVLFLQGATAHAQETAFVFYAAPSTSSLGEAKGFVCVADPGGTWQANPANLKNFSSIKHHVREVMGRKDVKLIGPINETEISQALQAICPAGIVFPKEATLRGKPVAEFMDAVGARSGKAYRPIGLTD